MLHTKLGSCGIDMTFFRKYRVLERLASVWFVLVFFKFEIVVSH